MNSIYHGGKNITTKDKSPLFWYEDISSSIYLVTGYSDIKKPYISEYELNEHAKILDLADGYNEANGKIVENIMKKIGLVFENEDLLVKDSWKDVGREVYGHDIDLALYPKFRDELLNTGYNVLKTYTTMENTLPTGYAILDSSVIDCKKVYLLTTDSDYVHLKVVKEELEQDGTPILGNIYTGETGRGQIELKEVEKKKKKIS